MINEIEGGISMDYALSPSQFEYRKKSFSHYSFFNSYAYAIHIGDHPYYKFSGVDYSELYTWMEKVKNLPVGQRIPSYAQT